MKNFNENVIEFNRLVSTNQFIEAIDKFYSDQIIASDNGGEPTKGIVAYKEATDRFIKETTNLKSELLNIIISENMSVSERHYTFDHTKIGHWDSKQISVQKWKDDKILFEHHFFNNGE